MSNTHYIETPHDMDIALSSELTACGLNADWNCQAWHVGPSVHPNSTGGDRYILDGEDGTYSLVEHWFLCTEDGTDYPGMPYEYRNDEYCDGHNDFVREVARWSAGELARTIEQGNLQKFLSVALETPNEWL